MHHTTDRITHTTAFVTPVVEHWLEHLLTFLHLRGVRFSSVVECSLMVQWVLGLIHHGGPVNLFLVPKAMVCAIMSAYRITL